MASATVSLGVLAVVTLIGVVCAFDGYRFANRLLAWIGWIAGAIAGGSAGWLLAGSNKLVVTGVLLVVGATLGRIVVPLVGWFAVVTAGFLASSAAALAVLAGRQIAAALATIDFAVTSPEELQTVLTRVAEIGAFHDQQTIGLTLVVGLVGAIVAARVYRLVVTLTITAIGAALLSVATPLWRHAGTGRVSFEGGLTGVSPVWFGGVLGLGLLVQAFRYRDDLDL